MRRGGRRARALNSAKNSPSLMQAAQAAKRISNILKKSEKQPLYEVKEDLFSCNQEKVLYNTLRDVKEKLSKKILTTETAYKETFTLLAMLSNPLEDFFKEVMVNVEKVEIKNNRLALLKEIQVLLTKQISDLSKLQIK